MNSISARNLHGIQAGVRLYEESSARAERRSFKEAFLDKRMRALSESFRISSGSHQYLRKRLARISHDPQNNVDCLYEDESSSVSSVEIIKDFNRSGSSFELASTKASTEPSPVAEPCILAASERIPYPIPTPSPRVRRPTIPWSQYFSDIMKDLR